MARKSNVQKITTSPVVQQAVRMDADLNFFQALERAFSQGARITKREWNNPAIWLCFQGGRLKIHKADGTYADLLVSDGDAAGTDWVVLP